MTRTRLTVLYKAPPNDVVDFEFIEKVAYEIDNLDKHRIEAARPFWDDWQKSRRAEFLEKFEKAFSADQQQLIREFQTSCKRENISTTIDVQELPRDNQGETQRQSG